MKCVVVRVVKRPESHTVRWRCEGRERRREREDRMKGGERDGEDGSEREVVEGGGGEKGIEGEGKGGGR